MRFRTLLQADRGPIEVQAEMAVADEEAAGPAVPAPERDRAGLQPRRP